MSRCDHPQCTGVHSSRPNPCPAYRERALERKRVRKRERWATDPEYRERDLARQRERRRERMMTETCRNGHPRTEENTLIRRDGVRTCRSCCSENARKGGLAVSASLTPEQRREKARKGGLKGGLAVSASLTPEQRREKARKGGLAASASLTPEQRREKARKGGLKSALIFHERIRTDPDFRLQMSMKNTLGQLRYWASQPIVSPVENRTEVVVIGKLSIVNKRGEMRAY